MATGDLSGKPDKMLGGYLWWTSNPSRRSSNTPNGNRDKLQLCGPLGSCADFTLPYLSHTKDQMKIFVKFFSFFSQYFKANKDRNTVVTNALSTPIRARYIRIIPWGWRSHISMRAEFYGCYVGKMLWAFVNLDIDQCLCSPSNSNTL